MHRRKLGLNGPEVGAIGLGCMGMSDLYGYADRAGSIAAIHAALVVRMIEAKILPACRELGIGITASGVLARGSSPAIGRRSRQNRRISAPPPQASPAAISTSANSRELERRWTDRGTGRGERPGGVFCLNDGACAAKTRSSYRIPQAGSAGGASSFLRLRFRLVLDSTRLIGTWSGLTRGNHE